MNTTQLKAIWNQLKGGLQQEFGKLTDDDLTEARGDFNKLCAKIESVYGLTKEKSQEKLQTYLDRFDEDGNEITSFDKVASMVHNIKDKKQEVEQYVQNNPVKSVVGAAAVGAAVGAIISRL
jgi:uncharacterized protein YjbJ (UPF0337 family)